MNDPTSWGAVASLALLASVKYLYTPPVILELGYSFWETIFIMLAGGIAGTLVWYYIGGLLIKGIQALWQRVVPPSNKPKKKFSRKNKLIVKVKSRWGLIGLALITPTIISIPIGTLLAARYFGHNWRTLPYMLLSVVGWGFVATIGWDFIVPVVKGWFA